MFVYIASHAMGATRFDCATVGELILDMGHAHGLSGPQPEEVRQIATWAVDAQPGAALEWRAGWVFRINPDLPVKEVTS